jgi:hypothetical protein
MFQSSDPELKLIKPNKAIKNRSLTTGMVYLLIERISQVLLLNFLLLGGLNIWLAKMTLVQYQLDSEL